MKIQLRSGQTYNNSNGQDRFIKQERLANGRYVNRWVVQYKEPGGYLHSYWEGSYADILDYITSMKFRLVSNPVSK